MVIAFVIIAIFIVIGIVIGLLKKPPLENKDDELSKQLRERYRRLPPEARKGMTEDEYVKYYYNYNAPDTPYIKENIEPTLIDCPACGHKVSSEAPNCPQCGHPIASKRCPRCGSKNVEIITGADKAVSIAVWGVFSANKVINHYKCKDCGQKF